MDAEIRDCLRTGDRRALELIWDAYADGLLVFLAGALRSRSDAEDALQDLFVTIARKRTAVSEAKNLKAYLYRMARNVAVNRMQGESRRRERNRAADAWLVPRDVNAERERAEVVQAALSKLPASQRLVITMKFFRDKTFREISELLGISENTAGSRYRYGMEKLRTLLRGDIQ